MTVDQLKLLIVTGDVDKIISVLTTFKTITDIQTALSQYDPKKHSITNTTTRPDKLIKDDKGDITGTVKVARIPLAFQKKITRITAAFLGSAKLQGLAANDGEKNLLTIVNKVWKDNKLDYKFKAIAKTTMSEKECAEIWYMRPVDKSDAVSGNVGYWAGFPINQTAKYRLAVKLLSNSLGDTMYPLFDDFGDMIAFGRAFKTKDGDGKEVKHFELYTADTFYYWKNDNVWSEEQPPVRNIINKIPIIYYQQPLTEWDDVQELIERMEFIISNHADTNDYFDSPMLVGKGGTISLPDKYETGKYVEIKGDGSLEYLTYDGAPESKKMEIENLLEWIHAITSTPDISFKNLKNLGYFSTAALQTIFMDAHIKAMDKEEIFGEGLQRRVNYIKRAIAVIDPSFGPSLSLWISVGFDYFIPKNVQEIVQTLVSAVSGGIMTQDTAIRQNPLVDDPDAEIDNLAAETPPPAPLPPVLPTPPSADPAK
jgi:SPP1 family phage portal protein